VLKKGLAVSEAAENVARSGVFDSVFCANRWQMPGIVRWRTAFTGDGT
jgi:hypothetical protein